MSSGRTNIDVRWTYKTYDVCWITQTSVPINTFFLLQYIVDTLPTRIFIYDNNEHLCILIFFLTLNRTFYNRINKPNDAFPPPPPPPLSIGFPYEKVQQDSSSSSIILPFQVTIFLLVATISMLVPKTWALIWSNASKESQIFLVKLERNNMVMRSTDHESRSRTNDL